MRLLRSLLAILLFLPVLALAQTGPQVTVTPPEGDIIVGQPVTLRITVLVPTWMPKPPVYPSIEVPDLLVRLPERATTPTSQKVEGETWSGTTRGYRLYPLARGTYEIPAQDMIVTWADPDTTEPRTETVRFGPVRFSADVPEGARDLNPPIIASAFSLEQTVEGGPTLDPGDAVVRTVTASIGGTTPILIPVLLKDLPASDMALRAYPAEPQVAESENRGVLSGTRTEKVSYVAQGEGAVDLPPVTFEWFNLETGKVESATAEGVTLTVNAPPPPPPDPWEIAKWLAIALALGTVGFLIWRRLAPRVDRAVANIKDRYLQSEYHAARQVTHALKANELAGTYAALDVWQKRIDLPESDRIRFSEALAAIGKDRFGSSTSSNVLPAWETAARVFGDARKHANEQEKSLKNRGKLPYLNP